MSNRAVKWAWRQRLKPPAKAVLVALADMAGADLTCYPGMKLLAEMTGYSEKTVERAIDDLEAGGLIGRERRNGRGGYRTSNLYRLALPNGQGDGKAKPSESRVGDARLTDSVSVPNRQSDGAEENPQIEPPEEPTDILAPLVLVPTGEGDRFDEFWQVYPRKAAKPDARKAWVKAVAKVGAEAVLVAVRAYAASPNLPERQYIPYPATWLNREGWEDEAPAPIVTRGSEKQAASLALVARYREEERRAEIGSGEAAGVHAGGGQAGDQRAFGGGLA